MSQAAEAESLCGCNIYRNDAVRLLLGESWHPGGLRLSAKLAQALEITAEDAVLDVACGIGQTPLFLARTFNCYVAGIDASVESIQEATKLTSPSSAAPNVKFEHANSANLPYKDESFTAAIIECALSSFKQKEASIKEVYRILKPRGRIGITDISVESELPDELRTGIFETLCVARAMKAGEYVSLLTRHGFDEVSVRDESNSLLEFVEDVRKKVLLAELLKGIGKLQLDDDKIRKAKRVLSLVKDSVLTRRLGYIMITARR